MSKLLPPYSRFPEPAKLEEAAKQLTAKAADAGVRAALVGGYALQHYGSGRLTEDVDFAATGEIEARKIRRLSFGGWVIKAPNKIESDWIVRADAYEKLYEEAIKTARKTSGGYLIARPEYLAATKMVAGRDKDYDDLLWLLQQDDLVNRNKAREIVGRLLGAYAADDFDRAAEEADWRKSRGHGPFEGTRGK